MTTADDDSANIKAVDKALRIVEAMADQGCGGVSEIASELGMAKSTVHVHLKTLEDHEFVVQSEDGYQLGLRFLDIGIQVRDNHSIVELARPELTELAAETGETCWLAVEENGKCVFVDMVSGDQALQTRGRIGQREYMHCVSAGKAMLAHLPDERVAEIIDEHGLPKLTENTIVDEDELYRELEMVREQGYATNNGEEVAGLLAIAAPIVSDNEVIGGVSVSGPENRLKRDSISNTIYESVMATANAIGLRANY